MNLLLGLLAAVVFNSGSAQAFWAGPQYCPTCAMMGRGGMWGPSFYPSYYPWYSPYGAMSYPNYFYPGAYMGWGMNGMMYPGAGHGWAGKPNLYIDAPEGTRVSVKIDTPSDTTILAAVPALKNGAWDFVSTGPGKTLNAEGAEYRYGFYDLRFDEKRLQDTRGFTVSRKDVIHRLARILENAGFTKPEVGDFARYWVTKLPPAENFHVFPQESAEFDAVAGLKIQPKPAKILRITFLLVPLEAMPSRTGEPKFAQGPSREWTPPIGTGTRAPASEGITVREWAVGFLSGK